MTNREAIEILQFHAEIADPEFKDALVLAISALEKQERAENEWCPGCKLWDAISEIPVEEEE